MWNATRERNRCPGLDCDVSVVKGLVRPACRAGLRASDVTRHDGITRLTCSNCHTLEIEQHRAEHDHGGAVL
jgi:hypothetical protein